jgi:fatty acid desaturase
LASERSFASAGTHRAKKSMRGAESASQGGTERIEERTMLWTIIAILLVLWLLGLIGNIGGGLIWLLLVIAAIVLVFQLLSGRRAV